MKNLELRFVKALERIAQAVDTKKKAIRMVDIERAKVYSKHLGRKLK